MVGAASGMRDLLQTMLKVSQSDEPLMILGETGTGKELVAKCIHHMGLRRAAPFLPVDCSTLVPQLMESELFGHVRGAFTGAITNTKGLFETALGGTVFLDEIGELPIALQSKLLRAVQEHEVRPVGSTHWVKFHARIIVATNCDLAVAIQQGKFREDLYYRLNVLSLRLPPLRERREDILPLANHFLAKFSKIGEPPLELSPECAACLESYAWPGNIRELENCIRRIIVLSSGPVVQVAELASNMRESAETIPPGNISDKVSLLSEVERQAVVRAIAESNWDIPRAARILGIGRTTIYRKLKEYGISRSGFIKCLPNTEQDGESAPPDARHLDTPALKTKPAT